VLHTSHAREPKNVERFVLQARTAARIEHANVVQVLDLGQDPGDGSFFIVQEFLKGTDLRHALGSTPMPPAEALDILIPIMDGLVAVHAHGIIHRDIKPENIFLSRSPAGEVVPKLIDFGVAKAPVEEGLRITTVNTLLGTVDYMPPEQLRGDALDGRADVWAVGVVLYEMLAGRRPFEGPTDAAVLTAVLSTAAPRIEEQARVPADLAAVVHRALEPDRERRFASMLEMLQALLACEGMKGKVDHAPTSRGMPVAEAADGAISLRSEDLLEIAPRAFDDEHAEGRDPREALRDATEDALRVNALDDAIVYADRAIEAGVAGDDLVRVRLVKATAHHWRGEHAFAEESARLALGELGTRSALFFQALGERGVALGHLGAYEVLLTLAKELEESLRGVEELTHPTTEEALARHVACATACCRVAVWLLYAPGSPELALALYGRARTMVRRIENAPSAQAWVHVVRGRIASREGDVARVITEARAAVEAFARANDARNACRWRAHLGREYLAVGAYEDAERTLREVLAASRAMTMDIAPWVTTHLAMAVARRGDVEAGREMAVESVIELLQHPRRFTSYARTCLAQLFVLSGDLEEAEREARGALEVTSTPPDWRAFALATLAGVLLRRERIPEALGTAQRARDLLEPLPGVQECDAMVSLAYGVALQASGSAEAGAAVLREAAERLRARADAIDDAELRVCFLERVPEHAGTIARAQ
jgi:tetratricopeptide (TPR) repeat protein